MRRKSVQTSDEKIVASTSTRTTKDIIISNDTINLDGLAKRNVNPVPMWDSMCLIFSSSFFLIPAYYAYVQSNSLGYFCMVVSILTSLVSMNYWRHSTSEGWSLRLDYLFSRGSFVVYLVIGVCYVRNIHLIIIGWIQAFLIIFFYKLSCYLWDKDSPNWVYAHMLFHLVGSLNKALVVLGSFDDVRTEEITTFFFK